MGNIKIVEKQDKDDFEKACNELLKRGYKLSSSSCNLEKIQEEYYQEIVKILKRKDDNGWLVDYFFNDHLSADELLENLDIDVESK